MPTLRVLGIDAAWTPSGNSGVALVEVRNGRPRLKLVARSFAEASQQTVAWDSPPPPGGRLQDIRDIVKEADIVAADIPLSRKKIDGRRDADNQVSKKYGAYGAGTHTASQNRPGPISPLFFKTIEGLGLTFVTTLDSKRQRAFLETYPHPAIIELMKLEYRLRYKVQRRAQFWRDETPERRLHCVAERMDRLARVLASQINGVSALPSAISVVKSGRPGAIGMLKGLEDVLDAVVCAWVGLLFHRGSAIPYGDDVAAIWLPPHTAPAPRPCGQTLRGTIE